jgi:hypothetical protein
VHYNVAIRNQSLAGDHYARSGAQAAVTGASLDPENAGAQSFHVARPDGERRGGQRQTSRKKEQRTRFKPDHNAPPWME